MAKFSVYCKCLVALWIMEVSAIPEARAAPGDEILRLTQNTPGDSKPIVLHADQISSWIEGGQRVILLKGTVLVEQGVVHARMQNAIVWIDLDQKRKNGILQLKAYGEGDVRLESGLNNKKGTRAVLELNTRGEVKLKSQQGKVVQQPMLNDPLYRRATSELAGLVAPAATGVQSVSGVGKTGITPPPPSPAPPAGQSGADKSSNTPAGLRRTSGFQLPSNESGIIPAGGQVPPAGPPTPGELPPASIGAPAPRSVPPAATGLPPVTVPSPTAPPAVAPMTVSPPPVPLPGSAPGPPPLRQLRIVPRTSLPIQYKFTPLSNGEEALFITGGVILTVLGAPGTTGLLDIEADRVIVWSHGNLRNLMTGVQTPEGHSSREGEFYLAGNVEIRAQSGTETRTLRADECYYDVSRHVAVARNADLEFKQPGVTEPIHFRADEMLQLSATQFKGYRAEIFASKLPSDPGLKIYVQEATLENKIIPKQTIFGRQYFNRKTGEAETETQRLVHGDNVFLEVEDFPIFYLPFVQGDANDPLGPLRQLNFKYDRIFGFQFNSAFNVYDLIGIDPVPGTNWKFYFDYLTRRGPGIGSDYDYKGKDLFDVPGDYLGLVKAYGIHDTGTDILGGGRGEFDHHPELRGRFTWRHLQDLPCDFSLQAQISALSDKNFLEQYYKNEFDREANQESFLYLKQQRDNWAWTVLVEQRIRNWVTETNRLPEVSGYLIGQSFFDLLTYNVRASAGYDQLRPTEAPPPPEDLTTIATNTARLDLFQELSLPFSLGPVRLVPYGVLELTYYSSDLTGSDRGRVYGGGGLRASIPFTRLYPDIQSELFNLNGIDHKIVASTNLYFAHSDTSFSRLPQLDRINDDATDQALRDIKPLEPVFIPGTGVLLATSPLYDPQRYAIRRLVDNRIDTLDSIEVLQFDVRQRWQTKRGYPGMQHIVDWMTLDLSGSYFFDSNRDNFGQNFAFLQYDWTWNIGDRTALVSTGWVDPLENGARVFTVGAFFNRPDRTNLYLGYREIDPLSSRALSGAITYIFSPKYAMTASAVYDFGTSQSQSNSLIFTRMGSDLQVSFGINYNSILNTFGVTFEIVPNVVPQNKRIPGMAGIGPGGFLAR